MRTLRIVLAIVAAAITTDRVNAQATPAADGKVTVAVFPLSGFMPVAADKELAAVFRSMIVTELGTNTKLVVVERDAIDRIMVAQNLSMTGTLSVDDAVRVGRLIGAQYAVTGSITFDQANARLDLRMIDIETSETVSKPFKETVPKGKILALTDRVATDFANTVRVKPRVADIVVPAAAMLAYSRGMDFEKRGRKPEAARMYTKALELFPQHPHARAALQRVN